MPSTNPTLRFRCDPAMAARLKQLAKDLDLSFSAFCRVYLGAAADQLQNKAPKGKCVEPPT